MSAPLRVHRLFYVSRATLNSVRDVQDIVQISRDRNSQLQVSGMLAFSGDHFAQVLEGDAEALAALMTSIRADARHRIEWEWEMIPVEARRYPDWSMGYLYNDDLEDLVLQLRAAATLPPFEDVAHALFSTVDLNKRSRTPPL